MADTGICLPWCCYRQWELLYPFYIGCRVACKHLHTDLFLVEMTQSTVNKVQVDHDVDVAYHNLQRGIAMKILLMFILWHVYTN